MVAFSTLPEISVNGISIDADKLEYISSAGLRVILRLRKEEPKLAIINVAADVYEGFDMTGFTDMVTVEKAYQRMSVDGCEFIAKGANGAVYRYDDETILKTYFAKDAQPESAEALILFEENNPALIESFYPGLTGMELSQSAYYMPPIATHPCEIVLVEAKNTADADKVAEILKARIDMGSDNKSYPESAKGWQLYAQVQRSGSFVCMIVLPEGNVIPENVFALQSAQAVNE